MADRPRLDAMDTVDQALDICVNIRTLGQLLAASGSAQGGAGLEPEVVSNAGWLIKEQAGQLRELVRQLQPPGSINSRRRRR